MQKIIHREIERKSGTGLTVRGYLEGDAASLEGGAKCPLIVFFHGLMDSNEFEPIRNQVNIYEAAGFAVLAFDFNGHGKSDGDIMDMTIGKELLDAEAVMDYAKTLPFVSGLYLIGHSQGGAVASMTAPKYNGSIDKLILLAPGGFIADMARSGNFFGVQGDVNNPPEKVPMFGAFLGGGYFSDAAKLDIYGTAAGLKGKEILLVTAGEDADDINKVAVPTYEKRYLEGGNRVSRKHIEGAPHDFSGHEPELAEAVLAFIKG